MSVDDGQVVEAFAYGARQAFGPTLHVEGDALLARGWWQAAFRVSPDTFIVNSEEPREETNAIELVRAALTARGLKPLAEDHPLIQALTYTELSVAGVSWTLWSLDRETGEAELAGRVGAESTFSDVGTGQEAVVGDFSSELEGARRIAGLPPSVILTVGLGPDDVRQLQVALPQCRFEARAMGEIAPDACGEVHSSLVLVDATGSPGREFIMELRAAACGRFLPVAAVADPQTLPAGADVALDPQLAPSTWSDDLRRLLP